MTRKGWEVALQAEGTAGVNAREESKPGHKSLVWLDGRMQAAAGLGGVGAWGWPAGVCFAPLADCEPSTP